VHNKAPIDAQRLTGHVIRARRHQKPDHISDILGSLHTPQRDPLRLPSGELLG